MPPRQRTSRTRQAENTPEPRPDSITQISDEPCLLGTDDIEERQIEFFDREQETLYHRFHTQGLRPSRCVSDDVHAFGIAEPVAALFSTLGWETLYNVREMSFRSLTLEFLSSYRYHAPLRGFTMGAFIDFRLLGRNFRLSIHQLAAILGVPPQRSSRTPDVNDYETRDFWSIIAGDNFSPQRSKSAEIRHPAIRYLHQFMTSFLFARAAPGTVNNTEVNFLIMALRHAIPDHIVPTERVDVATRVAHHFQQLLSPGRMTPICIGGIVTMIA